ncbi:hypothetical protein AAC387_Pa05g3571 [Persea americana]
MHAPCPNKNTPIRSTPNHITSPLSLHGPYGKLNVTQFTSLPKTSQTNPYKSNVLISPPYPKIREISGTIAKS